MKHYGDICKLHGDEIPAVDVITGGSPCQDLSVAGNRAGLAGERSGLFMEQIRIVKEMREADVRSGRTNEFCRPRFMVWENVPGALSSGNPKGEDFRIVLEEIARVCDPTAVIPRPEKWANAGCILADGWSVAWRVHDAQFWGPTQNIDGRVWLRGTPQRRRRIALVADFGGRSAPEILFERKSLSGDFEPGGEAWEGVAGRTEESPGAASYTLKIRGGREIDSAGKKAGKGALVQAEKAGTVAAAQDQTLIDLKSTAYGIGSYDSNAMKSGNPNSGIYKADTSRTLDINGGSPDTHQGGVAVVQHT